MLSFCPKCGVKINENVRLCPSCGTNFGENAVPTQGFTPTIQSPNKSKNKILALVAITVVAIIIIVVVFVLFLGGDAGKFVGDWAVSSTNGTTPAVKFNSDGTFISYTNDLGTSGTWEIKDGILYLSLQNQTVSANYSFSNNDKILTLIFINPGGESVVFVKQ